MFQKTMGSVSITHLFHGTALLVSPSNSWAGLVTLVSPVCLPSYLKLVMSMKPNLVQKVVSWIANGDEHSS